MSSFEFHLYNQLFKNKVSKTGHLLPLRFFITFFCFIKVPQPLSRSVFLTMKFKIDMVAFHTFC